MQMSYCHIKMSVGKYLVVLLEPLSQDSRDSSIGKTPDLQSVKQEFEQGVF